MIGVVRSEAYFALTADDAQYGIEADRRTKILREFVRNTYTYHQAEILATIINEYTDWERPVQHPVNIKWAQTMLSSPFLSSSRICNFSLNRNIFLSETRVILDSQWAECKSNPLHNLRSAPIAYHLFVHFCGRSFTLSPPPPQIWSKERRKGSLLINVTILNVYW